MQSKPELLNRLRENFNDSELRDLCLELSIDYENLSGSSKSDKARELIFYLERRGQLLRLLELCQQLRPHLDWSLPGYPSPRSLEAAPAEAAAPPGAEEAPDGGSTIQTGGGAYVGGNVNTGGGDLVGRDQITTGNLANNEGVAIGAGASAEVTHGVSGGVSAGGNVIIVQGDYLAERTMPVTERPQERDDPAMLRQEAIRLDVATPPTAVVGEAFDMAVVIRQVTSPPLTLDDLTNVASAEGTVYRSAASDVVKYRVEVHAAGCDIQPNRYTFFLRLGEDSPPRFFQVTPQRAGRLSLIVNAYQEDDALAASTRVQLTATVKVAPDSPSH